MSNILVAASANAIKSRINNLQANNQRQWGKLTIDQMLPHLADQIKMATGDLPVPDKGNFFTKHILKRIVLAKNELPKNIVSGAPFNAPAQTINADLLSPLKLQVIEWIDRFVVLDETAVHPHPAFGKLTKQQWGRLIYQHMDHHLRQFGG
jgi:hypothetical protein